jgi:cytochrome P450
MMFLFAWYDTVATFLTRACYQLWKSPETKQKIKEEFKKVVLNNGEKSAEDISDVLYLDKVNEMEYLGCFIKEVLLVMMVHPSDRLHKKQWRSSLLIMDL